MPPSEPARTCEPSGQADIAERVQCMLLDECKLMANPRYIEAVQTESMNPNFRRRITEWMLSVRSPAVAPHAPTTFSSTVHWFAAGDIWPHVLCCSELYGQILELPQRHNKDVQARGEPIKNNADVRRRPHIASPHRQCRVYGLLPSSTSAFL